MKGMDRIRSRTGLITSCFTNEFGEKAVTDWENTLAPLIIAPLAASEINGDGDVTFKKLREDENDRRARIPD